MTAPRRNEPVPIIAGLGRTIPITERLTVRLTPSMAARLAAMTALTGVTAEALIIDLLDDALPAPSREQSTSRE
jgi:hypothetical protein